jgi:hypothetical protein
VKWCGTRFYISRKKRIAINMWPALQLFRKLLRPQKEGMQTYTGMPEFSGKGGWLHVGESFWFVGTFLLEDGCCLGRRYVLRHGEWIGS